MSLGRFIKIVFIRLLFIISELLINLVFVELYINVMKEFGLIVFVVVVFCGVFGRGWKISK